MTVRILLLGPVEVRDGDDRPVEVGGTRLRALLARLALEPHRTVGTDTLVEAIWGDDSPAGSANALQALAYRLRRVIGRDTVESVPGGYRLAIDPDMVDAVRFERLATDGNRRSDAAALREAESLWRGAPLADLADHRFAIEATARLEQLRLTAAECRLAIELAAGADVLSELQPLAAAHPLRERLQALLIRALHATGRQAEALDVYERTRRALADELGADPSAELSAVHLAVLRHGQDGHEKRTTRTPTNLPALLTSFVGRETEVARLGEALIAYRLVTVIGPGGAGKTRLAVETANHAEHVAPDGIWLVELASVTDPSAVAPAVLAAMGARESALFEASAPEASPTRGDLLRRLVQYVGDRRILLVLDNCEHVIAEAAHLTSRLLAECRDLRVLATSRESLGVPGEHLFPVPPLAWPEGTVDDATTYPAVRLFVDRASAVRPDFTIGDEKANGGHDLEAVIEICRRLDGMPLAIELAAARMRALNVEQIATGLDDRFRLLTSGSRTAPPKQQTLRATVRWSWDLLSDAEADLAMRLAVFPGGATLDALSAVIDRTDHLPRPEEPELIDVLAGLVDKSLVDLVGDRYRMLETIRSYGLERLAEHGLERSTRDAHARHFMEFAERGDAELRGSDQLAWMVRMRADYDNIMAAMWYAVDMDDSELEIRLAAAMMWFWMMHGRRPDRLRTASAAGIPCGVPTELRPAAQILYAFSIYDSVDVDVVMAELRRGYEMRDRTKPLDQTPAGFLQVFALAFLKDTDAVASVVDELTGWSRAMMLLELSIAHWNDHTGEHLAGLDEARQIFAQLGERFGLSSVLRLQADQHARRGELEKTESELTEALRLIAELDATEDHAQVLCELAILHARSGDMDRAWARIDEAWVLVESVRQPETTSHARLARAEVMFQLEDWAAAEREIDAAEDEAEGTGHRHTVHGWGEAGRTMIALHHGDLVAARRWAEEAVRSAIVGRDRQVLAHAVQAAASVTLREGDPTLAARLLGVVTKLGGIPGWLSAGVESDQRAREQTRALLGDEVYQAEHDRGAALSDQAALDTIQPSPVNE